MGTGEDHAMNIAYVFYIYMFGFIVPFAIIFTCYLKIIKTITIKVLRIVDLDCNDSDTFCRASRLRQQQTRAAGRPGTGSSPSWWLSWYAS